MRLLLFNLAVDADHPVFGFTTVWINALAQHYDHIDVLTMQQGRLALADNVRVYSVGREHGYSEPRRAVHFYSILLRLLLANRYDACFAHMQPLFALMGWPLLALRGVPITLWYAHKATPWRVRLAEKVVQQVVTSSLDGFRLPSKKVVVVGQGIDTTLFSPAATSAPRPLTLVSVSRIAPSKRLDVLIEAAHLLAQAGIEFRLRIVGDADEDNQTYLADLRQQVETYDLRGCVEFAGGIAYDRVADVYRQSDVMLNVSSTGSIDKAVLEAMACGLPVITANEAFTSILQPWRDQLLLPSNAPADKLAEAIQRLMTLTSAGRRALGVELRQVVVEQHSLDRLTHNLRRVMH